MKKIKVIICILLLCMSIGAVTAYFAYGSTLIDITSEKSINEKLAVDPKQPITIFATKKSGDNFGILYTDPTDENEEYYHFRYITKAKFYKNKYHNIGGYAKCSIIDPNISFYVLNNVENLKTAELFIFTLDSSVFENNICSVFEYNWKDSVIDLEEITDEKQIIEKLQISADSYKKLDEFELPDEDTYMISKTYELSQNDNEIVVVNGSVSVEDMRKTAMDNVWNLSDL